MKEMILCSVYKSSDNGETYLFVDYAQGLTAIPEALKETFSSPILVTSFKLHPEKKLARAKATVVMEAIDDQGFYLHCSKWHLKTKNYLDKVTWIRSCQIIGGSRKSYRI